MDSPAVFRRAAAAAGLLGAALLAAASRFLYQPQDTGPTALLVSFSAAHGRALASTVLFVVAELPGIAAALGIGHLLRSRRPALSNIGTSLAVAGAFADAVAGAFTLVFVQMAQVPSASPAYADVVARARTVEHGFSLVGLLGTVLGLLLLSIGLFRAHIGPRWVPPLLWAFLALEFVGSSILPFLGLVSVLVLLAAYTALAATVARSSAAEWATSVPDRRTTPAAVAA